MEWCDNCHQKYAYCEIPCSCGKQFCEECAIELEKTFKFDHEEFEFVKCPYC